MGYTTASGRYARTREVTLAAAGTVITATGVIAGSTVELGDAVSLRLDLTVSAVAGTSPSATVAVQTSKDGSTGWTTVASFTAATDTGTEHKLFGPIDRFVRLNVTAFSGTSTPSVTAGVTGEAV